MTKDAAEQGDARAQYNLGEMYLYGDGVPQDYVQAHKWFNLATARIAGEYSPEVIQQGYRPDCCRVEGRRVAGRGVGGSSGAFAAGPQADSHGHVSSPRSPNPAGRFPAPGSPVESCGSHTGSRSRPTGGSREPWHLARTLAPTGRCVVRPVDALATATTQVVPFACACDDVRNYCSSPGYGVRVAMERKPGVFGDHAVSVRDSSSGVDASHALPGRARR